MKKYLLLLILSFGLLTSSIGMADTFVVKNIQIEGLQRVSADTVYNYLPIKKGQVLNTNQSGSIISALYKTGFFEHISLDRSGSTLIITVIERPTIGQLKISGNRVIPTDKLNSVMKGVDVAEGRVFNRAMLEKIRQSMLNQYYQLGRYNARVDVTVTPMERNRVLVKIDISEGLVAVIRNINIIGNKAFTERQLKKQLTISTPGVFTVFTEKDRYSQEKLDESMENLHNFYTDRGYIRFAIQSSQVEITPDRKSIYITVVIKEGDLYTIKGVDLRGEFIVPKEELAQLITIKPGDTFSRQATLDTEKSISNALGNKGYVFASISVNPDINDVTKQVYLTINVKPGKRIYVNHVNFANNSKTNDIVLRREVTQMEGGVISSDKLEESKRNLSMLPYFKDVQMSVVPVPNKDDQVDVGYKVTEESAAQANFSIGYSQRDKVLLGVGFNQKNFLGTGKTLGINLQRSVVTSDYGISYTDPYYTLDGISRSLNLSVSQFHPAKVTGLTNSFNTNVYEASVIYGIPLSQDKNVVNKAQLGYGYQGTLVNLQRASPTQQVTAFVNANGRNFQQIELISGITRDSRDRAIFPTRGMQQSLGVTLFLPVGHNLSYYQAMYTTRGYLPLIGAFILSGKGQLGYGNSFQGINNYPFFKNYYTGGPDTVRGFQSSSLGPKGSDARATGGNELVNASVGLIFPNYLNDNLRTSFFVDAGQVYNSFDNRKYSGSGSGPIRYSVGIEADVLTPMGMIEVSLAKPLNFKKGADRRWGDLEEPFQFSLGANFG